MTKIFICTPAFDGKVNIQYAIALAETTNLLLANGIKIDIKISASGSLLVAERNRLLKAFLESDSTHMLCIDSDLGWPPQAVLSLINKDCDFIGGVYPSRRENTFLFRPVFNENNSIAVDVEKELLKMQFIPAGFMLIKRHVIEQVVRDNSHTYFKPKLSEAPDGHCIFNTEIRDGEFWGEDYVFCRLARESGFDIWVDPTITFDHAGVIGCVSSVLTNNPEQTHQLQKQ